MSEIDSVGAILKRKRKEKGYTQEQLGDLIEANKGSISRWESGEITNMGVDKAKKLCKVLDLSPLVFLEKESLSTISFDEISSSQFKEEVIKLLYRCPDLSDKEKQMLINNLNFLCEEKGDN